MKLDRYDDLRYVGVTTSEKGLIGQNVREASIGKFFERLTLSSEKKTIVADDDHDENDIGCFKIKF